MRIHEYHQVPKGLYENQTKPDGVDFRHRCRNRPAAGARRSEPCQVGRIHRHGRASNRGREIRHIYTKAKVRYEFRFGRSVTFDLKYHQLMATTDRIKGGLVGGLFDSNDTPLTDSDGQIASDAPDGTSLIDVPGMRSSNPWKFNALAMVTQFEYKELPPNDGVSSGSFWSKLPATMGLTILDQNRWTGALEAATTITLTSAPSMAAGSTADRRCRAGTPTSAPRNTSRMPRCAVAERRPPTRTMPRTSAASASTTSVLRQRPIPTIMAWCPR